MAALDMDQVFRTRVKDSPLKLIAGHGSEAYHCYKPLT